MSATDENSPNSKPPNQMIVTLVDQTEPLNESPSTSTNAVEAFMAPIREALNSPGIQAVLQGFAKRMSDDSATTQTNANATAELNKLQAQNAHALAMEQQKSATEIEKIRITTAKHLVIILAVLGVFLVLVFMYALEKQLIATSSLVAIGVVVGTAWTVAFGKATTKTGTPSKP